MSISLKNRREIEHMRAAGRIVAEAFALLGEQIKPGITLHALDQAVEEYLTSQKAKPLYKGYRGNPPKHPPFPGVICASVNDEICHGLPNGRVLRQGDIVGIDIGLKYNDWCGDACVTYAVGPISAEAQRLLDVAQECLHLGIAAAQPQHHLYDIGRAIQGYADTQGVSVVREWGGHGLGRTLHEPPSVSHIREAQRGPRLRPGMVFTIEPMINAGKAEWRLLDDGWTVVTVDGSLSAQFEHTVAITEHGPEILTRL
ncbi:MAG TPA: type I methionyl aminopeptidase [Anaerolineae bacterium]|nr:type I methionyl aminopeptidase [Anaerolineae bacterium]HXW01613.1 type I methionyl aminopeptidase [Anaerolineae bacterium]